MTRSIFYMRSKRDDVVKATPTWATQYRSEIACPMFSSHLGSAWRLRPRPIDVELERDPRGSIAGIFRSSVGLLREDLYEVLEPFLCDVLIGHVSIAGVAHGSRKSEYVSVVVKPERAINPYRGARVARRRCPECGFIENMSMADEAEGIVEYVLNERLIYGDDGSLLYVDGQLIKKLDLGGRFPDLRFIRYQVISTPLDGDVLPGDTNWNGVSHIRSDSARE
jgi:hypothetical protein